MSRSEILQTLFRPHGRIECHREGHVLHTQAEGPFNEEAVRAYGARLAELLSELPVGTPYVVVATMSNSILATPEAWQALEASLGQRQGGSRKQLGSAWVAAPGLEGRGFFVPRARALYEAFGARFELFDDEAAATAWALALLSGSTPS